MQVFSDIKTDALELLAVADITKPEEILRLQAEVKVINEVGDRLEAAILAVQSEQFTQ